MANLPQELINEILLWLPVKSLLRCRCVCKSFCAIIKSQSFINSHFKRSSENRIHCKLIELGMDNNGRILHALDFNEDFQQEVVLDKLLPTMTFDLLFSYCNGLVLLWIDKLSLWNPCTREYRILPAFPVKHTHNLSFALGYDSTTDDFKAVVITQKPGCDVSHVWVFELRSNCWRRIQNFNGYTSFKLGGNGDCFVDGALHFICWGNSFIIAAFDVAKETFSIVREFDDTVESPIRLHVFGGRLSMSFFGICSEFCVDIYARKFDGVTFTWTRLYSVTRQQFSEEAIYCFLQGKIAHSKKGDKVFLSSEGKLHSYDFGEKCLQEIVTKNAISLDIFSCIESLVSVGSLDEEE
ncbi:F-box protein CPR1-like [Euphorbia lathyris]|uniref:F-box protein CPR1-like n=1 Tax=Euphorbia lathyris TaxID=212925 RepID=UPI0033136F19